MRTFHVLPKLLTSPSTTVCAVAYRIQLESCEYKRETAKPFALPQLLLLCLLCQGTLGFRWSYKWLFNQLRPVLIAVASHHAFNKNCPLYLYHPEIRIRTPRFGISKCQTRDDTRVEGITLTSRSSASVTSDHATIVPKKTPVPAPQLTRAKSLATCDRSPSSQTLVSASSHPTSSTCHRKTYFPGPMHWRKEKLRFLWVCLVCERMNMKVNIEKSKVMFN